MGTELDQTRERLERVLARLPKTIMFLHLVADDPKVPEWFREEAAIRAQRLNEVLP